MAPRRKVLFLAVAAVGVAAIAVGVFVTVTTTAAQQPSVPSDAALYVFDTDGVLGKDGQQLTWNQDASGSLDAANFQTPTVCPTGSTNVASFVATFGNERTPTAWSMWEFLGYGVSTAAGGTGSSSVAIAPLTPDRMGSGTGQSIHKSGGLFSLGVACTTNNNLTVTAAYYRTIHVQAGGAWTIDPLN